MKGKIPFEFTAVLWQHPSEKGGWYFLSLPETLSAEIRAQLQWQEEGWGRLKAQANILETTWDTAIWFDSKANTYLLPLKAEIRKKCKLETGDLVKVMLGL